MATNILYTAQDGEQSSQTMIIQWVLAVQAIMEFSLWNYYSLPWTNQATTLFNMQKRER